MFEIFHYDFMIRAFIAGIAIAIIAPQIGTFIVMRRFSLFADSLSHVALAGVAIGIVTGIYPVITAVISCIIAALIIEKLRTGNKIYEDSALSLFLSGSLAIALILISLGNGFNVNLFSYLFGSITAVENTDIYLICGLAILISILIKLFYKELLFISFDEESAKVSGIPVKWLNFLFITLAATTVSLTMRIVGILMVGALMVIPVMSALQIAKSFKSTFIYSIIFSLISVISGLFISYYLNIIAGGSIVAVSLIIFTLMFFVSNKQK